MSNLTRDMMRRSLIAFLTILFIQITTLSFADENAKAQEYIELNLPASVISQVVTDIMPIQLDTDASVLTGQITVVKVENLVFDDQRLSSDITLAGRDMQLVTELAGHEIRMKVGNVDLDFKCNAVMRFDEAAQTLYVRPVVDDSSGAGAGQADIGQTVMALLNGREFPIELKNIEPLVAQASNKTITVKGHISDVNVTKRGVLLKLLPMVSTQ